MPDMAAKLLPNFGTPSVSLVTSHPSARVTLSGYLFVWLYSSVGVAVTVRFEADDDMSQTVHSVTMEVLQSDDSCPRANNCWGYSRYSYVGTNPPRLAIVQC